MNDDARDTRRAALVERLLTTHDLLADALGADVSAETHVGLARRVAADCAEIHLAYAAEVLGIPSLRSVVIAKAKLRGREIEPSRAEFMAQALTVSDMALQSAARWSSLPVPAERRRSLFLGLVTLHASLVQSVSLDFGDPAVKVAAENLEAEAKALAEEIPPIPDEAA